MQTISRVTGWLLLSLALSFQAGAQAPAAAPAGSPAAAPQQEGDLSKDQQKRSVNQPGNNSEVWREVRSGQSNYTSVPGREVGVLVQPQARFPGQDSMTTAGEAWRKFRNGPITFYGGWLVVAVLAILAAIYFALSRSSCTNRPPDARSCASP